MSSISFGVIMQSNASEPRDDASRWIGAGAKSPAGPSIVSLCGRPDSSVACGFKSCRSSMPPCGCPNGAIVVYPEGDLLGRSKHLLDPDSRGADWRPKSQRISGRSSVGCSGSSAHSTLSTLGFSISACSGVRGFPDPAPLLPRSGSGRAAKPAKSSSDYRAPVFTARKVDPRR
jgi:hypothetical protein